MPTHKLVLCTNNQPAIGETKSAIWRRLKLVPFTVEQVPEAEQQQDLPERLKKEYPGILAWAVRGCLDWVQGGLQTPRIIQDATLEYRGEEDVLGNFIQDECITGSMCRVRASILYTRYRKGLEGSGTVPMTQTAFGRTMGKRGFEKDRSDGIWYCGIDLRTNKQDNEDGSLLM